MLTLLTLFNFQSVPSIFKKRESTAPAFSPFISSLTTDYCPDQIPLAERQIQAYSTQSDNNAVSSQDSVPLSIPTAINRAARSHKAGIAEVQKTLDEKLNDLISKYKVRRDYIINIKAWGNWAYKKLDNLADKSQYYTIMEALVSKEHYEGIEWVAEQIDEAADSSKAIKPALDIISNLALSRMSKNVQNELLQIQKDYQSYFRQYPTKLKEHKQRIDSFQKELIDDQKKVQREIKESNFKLDQQLTSRILSYPLAKWLKADRNDVRKGLKHTFGLVESFVEWREARRDLSLQKEWVINLQPNLITLLEPRKESEETSESIQQFLLPWENRRLEVKLFMRSLKNCHTILEVKDKLKSAKIEIEIINWSDWQTKIKNPSFKQMLAQQYQVKKGLTQIVSPSHINKMLNKRKESLLLDIKKEENRVNEFLSRNKDKSFEEIQSELKQLHLAVTEEEWRAQAPLEKPMCINEQDWQSNRFDPHFFVAYLAEQIVRYHEATSIMVEKGARVGLLKKIEIEQRPLQVYQITRTLEIIFTIIELALSIPFISRFAVSYLSHLTFSKILIDYLTTKINFRGSELLYLLTDMETTIGGVIKQVSIRFIEFLLIRQVKPHLYSPEAYFISLQIKWVKFRISWIELIHDIYCCIAYLRKISLQLNIYLISTLRARIYSSKENKQEETVSKTETNTNEFEKRLDQYIENQKEKIKEKKAELTLLNGKLDQLSLKDFARAMQPPRRNPHLDKNELGISREEQLKRQYAETYEAQEVNPVTEMINALLRIDRTKASPQTIEFFKQNFDIDLIHLSESEITKKLEKFFAKDARKMLNTLNQFSMFKDIG